VILPQHLPRELREPAAATGAVSDLSRALGEWLDQKLREGIPYREMHDEIEALALKHLLGRFGHKPTVLARETRMNRVTLRKKIYPRVTFPWMTRLRSKMKIPPERTQVKVHKDPSSSRFTPDT
jgi:hypothetical protein